MGELGSARLSVLRCRWPLESSLHRPPSNMHGSLARVARVLSRNVAPLVESAVLRTGSTRVGPQVVGWNYEGRLDQHGCARCFSTKRRRRRGSVLGSAPDSGHTDRNEAQLRLSPAEFERAASTLLDRFEMAVTKLKDSNEGLEITRHPASGGSEAVDEASDLSSMPHGGQLSIKVASTGDMYWAGGTYWLSIDVRAGIVRLQSPLSGNFTYTYDPSSREWVGTEDGHRLIGMFTRDWIRQNNGVPDL